MRGVLHAVCGELQVRLLEGGQPRAQLVHRDAGREREVADPRERTAGDDQLLVGRLLDGEAVVAQVRAERVGLRGTDERPGAGAAGDDLVDGSVGDEPCRGR